MISSPQEKKSVGHLKGKVLFVTGASRGVGRAIALRAAKDGAKVVIASKSVKEDPRLGGTIHSVAEEVVALGGAALPLQVDVRDEKQVEEAIEKAVQTFGAIDILINNAGAIFLGQTPVTPMKKFDLVMAVNVRAAFLCSQKAFPYLKKAENPHILNLSPPLNLDPKWLKDHLAYTISKYGMSLCVLGMAEEFKVHGIAVNSLWPRTAVATAAIRNLVGGEEAIRRSRTPEILADAAHAIFVSSSRELTGQFLLDEDFLRTQGVTDFQKYAVETGQDLLADFFI